MSPTPAGTVAEVAHEVVRVSIDTGMSFNDFRERYERAVPALDVDRFLPLVSAQASWDDVVAATVENAPHGFIRYWSSDVASLMRLAGDGGSCASYLMGNHTIAQRMYTHDPAVMLYAPLRTAVHEDGHGRTWFAVDQPSSRFASFGNADIAKVGRELDAKLAALLEVLGIAVPLRLAS
ncbi:DUF302 domain-containing protein [Saccharopolyspora mangrovi]|uniref:DUF302 domain-containing protein n=1 Tax=Saccharopolyspora mangrovi TaxID=3082379 RepID=A0ABU6ABR5_9PSEU|nr:DUF302 domain-containing protein [Saccharopolyspora sp. S2-29]MEB3369008.1 DUF302 domain-containing protein [Saccharopolyspora sp. S2-29]